MTTYVFEKAKGGRYAAEGLGAWKQRNWWSYRADGALADGGLLVLNRSGWGREFTASDTGGRLVGSFHRREWIRERGPLTWEAVGYELGTKSGWRRTFTLGRHGEEWAELAVKGLRQDVHVTVRDGYRTPDGLLLFAAWVVLVLVRDRSAAASA